MGTLLFTASGTLESRQVREHEPTSIHLDPCERNDDAAQAIDEQIAAAAAPRLQGPVLHTLQASGIETQ